jgi:hypothetical protein
MSNKPTGHFGQELHVGDKIAMVAKSYGSCYMLVANIHSIKPIKNYYGREDFEVKVSYKKQKRKYKYDRLTGRGEYVDLGEKLQISRVYNWRTSITLESNHE